MSAPRLVLIGPPGAGKSTVGRLLAERLGEPCHDTDALVAERAGAAEAGDVMVDHGEEAFRELEAAVCADALAAPGIVALGSGALEAEATAARVAELGRDGTPVVLLEVSLAAAAPRLGLNVPRSVALGNARAQLSAMAEARRPGYEAAATAVLDTSGKDVEDVTASVAALADAVS